MKKILLSAVVIGALSLSFTGCKKDDVEKAGGYVAEVMSENLLSNADISMDSLLLEDGVYTSQIETWKKKGVKVEMNMIFCQDKRGILRNIMTGEGEGENETDTRYFEWKVVNNEINISFHKGEPFDTFIDEDGNNKLDKNNIYQIKLGKTGKIIEEEKLKVLDISPTTESCEEPV